MTNCRFTFAIALIGFFIASFTVSAHHGTSAYDTTKLTTVKGTVTDFQFNNPHVIISVEAKDDKGKVEIWISEANSPNVLTRHGWRPGHHQKRGPDHDYRESPQEWRENLASTEGRPVQRSRARPKFITGLMRVRSDKLNVRDVKLVRRSSEMRNCLTGPGSCPGGDPGLLSFPIRSNRRPAGDGKGQNRGSRTRTCPDFGFDCEISRRMSPINLDFGKAISPMTPWAEAKFKAANSVYRSSSPSTVLERSNFQLFSARRAANLSSQLSSADRSDSRPGDHALRVRSLCAPNLHGWAPA